MVRTRLLFVDHATTVGGGERSMMELAGTFDRKRYEISFAVPGPGPLARALAERGERIYYYRADASLLTFHREDISPLSVSWWRQVFRAFGTARSLRRVIDAASPHLIHTHSQKAHVFAALAAVASDVPLVWHMRDVLPGRFARGIMDLLAAISAERVVAISRTVAGQFRRARRRVAVVYNAVARPPAYPRRDGDRWREEWAIPADARIVGCVGQLAPWKGQHVFLDAAARLAADFPDVYFVVIGSPLYGAHSYRAELLDRVRRAGLGARVRFPGQLDGAARAMEAFDVLVHTPVKAEPFGRVVVEAMARGVPVVAARAGGVAEIMEDGREGFLTDVGSAGEVAAALAHTLDDASLAASMGALGRETYERRFTLERLGRDIRELYYDVLASTKGGLLPTADPAEGLTADATEERIRTAAPVA
ncbi:MAG: glycosyltransferase family 4 protein [Candidatus Zixiibacteriota bacterium]|jgi:glycosyltransferase involved in cell wall biosynthesis